MNYFHVHPEDARRLRRWLCSNLFCFLAIVCFLLALRFETAVPLTAMDPRRQDEPPAQVTARAGQTDGAALLPRSLVASQDRLPRKSPIAVAPQGWRRTDHGWEHVATWSSLPRPLGEIIRRQQDREPAWIQFVLGTLRHVPPLAFALLQITAITAIVVLTKPRKLAETHYDR